MAVAVFVVIPASAETSKKLIELTVTIAARCGVLNIAQFAAVQRNPMMQGALDQRIPKRIVTQLTWVAPAIRFGLLRESGAACND
jgi:hypothetical protein